MPPHILRCHFVLEGQRHQCRRNHHLRDGIAMSNGSPTYDLLDHVAMPFDLGRPDVMFMTIELEPGSAGSPPHRHSGPVFAYLIEGELIFELEGDPERVIKAG